MNYCCRFEHIQKLLILNILQFLPSCKKIIKSVLENGRFFYWTLGSADKAVYLFSPSNNDYVCPAAGNISFNILYWTSRCQHSLTSQFGTTVRHKKERRARGTYTSKESVLKSIYKRGLHLVNPSCYFAVQLCGI